MNGIFNRRFQFFGLLICSFSKALSTAANSSFSVNRFCLDNLQRRREQLQRPLNGCISCLSSWPLCLFKFFLTYLMRSRATDLWHLKIRYDKIYGICLKYPLWHREHLEDVNIWNPAEVRFRRKTSSVSGASSTTSIFSFIDVIFHPVFCNRRVSLW